MIAYCIFDDYPEEAIALLREAGIMVTIHPHGVPRPNEAQMKAILEAHECVIIGTTQKITETMFENICTPRIIATASAGIDHICVPEEKKELITLLNTPGVNAVSVAEYIVGAMLLIRKRYCEGNMLYSMGLNNKKLRRKPEELNATTVGMVGAGRIAEQVMRMLQAFGVRILCYTRNPQDHTDLWQMYNAEFVSLTELARGSDMIAVCVPDTDSTCQLINESVVREMKDTCTLISISRERVIDLDALIRKAEQCPDFGVVLDIDVADEYTEKCNGRNIFITPHIAGGTIESRKRMFMETANKIAELAKI